ncbi:MAG: hypothetical protein R2823_02500 [Acidimicrobiia bacterium]
MPPRLPERYRLNIRLGSDGDIEEWLAQDTELDRPVLVRYLAPEASHGRHATFLEGVRSAAALTELHLQKVFAAGETSASAYSVSEWDGGVSVADRMRAGEGLPVEEFLPNASGLCLALSKFHATGGVHGALDTSAIHYSAAHPAKIGAFGRTPRWRDRQSDTRALAEALRAGLTGTDDPSVMPSSVLDGVSPDIDETLAAGIRGDYDAASLAAHLSSATYRASQRDGSVSSWRSVLVMSFIAGAIALLAAVGLAAEFDPDSPFLFPVTGEVSGATTTVPIEIEDEQPADSLDATVMAYDPLGDGVESDDEVGNATDGDTSTAWPTEAYSRPITDFKEGVGLVFDVEGTPTVVYVRGTPDTAFTVDWAPDVPDGVDGWEHIGQGTLQRSRVQLQLPVRGGGLWRLWLIELPERSDGFFQAHIDEVRFSS